MVNGLNKENLNLNLNPTNSKTIISLCNKMVLVKVNIPVHYYVKKNCRNKICQGPISFVYGNNFQQEWPIAVAPPTTVAPSTG